MKRTRSAKHKAAPTTVYSDAQGSSAGLNVPALGLAFPISGWNVPSDLCPLRSSFSFRFRHKMPPQGARVGQACCGAGSSECDAFT